MVKSQPRIVKPFGNVSAARFNKLNPNAGGMMRITQKTKSTGLNSQTLYQSSRPQTSGTTAMPGGALLDPATIDHSGVDIQSANFDQTSAKIDD